MPYIKEERRKVFDKDLLKISFNIQTKGELTYCIYKLGCLFLHIIGTSYEYLSMITSSMEDSKLEFYRRKTAPYEDRKIIENGDVV